MPNQQSDEAHYIKQMQQLLQEKMKKTYPSGQTKRDAHPKHLALLKASFVIADQIPDKLRVGILREQKTYPAWVRISNSSGQIQSDTKKDFRGMAIKLYDVEGEKYIDDEHHTQDFVLLSHPTMPLGTVKLFHDAVYYTTKWSPFLFLAKMLLTGHARKLKELKKGKKNHTSPLDIRYWSTTPYQFGTDHVVKYAIVPTSIYTSKLPHPLTDRYLTDNIAKHLSEHEATFDFMIQLQKDPIQMPIEDASVKWDEKDSPFIKVATLIIPKQSFQTEKRNQLAESFSFSPGHCLKEHQPLGGINRARVEIYQSLAHFRHQRDHRALTEPHDLE
ncbi:catalase family protein [Hazenella sp. IB182357]|uniref:Catalase family protein n=1 Tax=Polycladospora coralii TaxID=2771432 RepID=A0A926NI01_9BACL|nr:catalase family protein [Polycladospora coralii]MBD1373638.1 catalase family protein [Polycladospora coralii]